MDISVMACLPVDRSGLPDLSGYDIQIPMPTDLYHQDVCENTLCRRAIWVGPRQAAAIQLSTVRAVKLCYMCAASYVVQANQGSVPVTELGGGAGVEGNVLA